MGMKLVQGGILVALVAIAGLLYSIKRQMTTQPAAAPVESAQAMPATGAQPGVAPQTALQPAQPAARPSPLPQAANPPAPAGTGAYQTIPRSPAQRSAQGSPAPSYGRPAPTYTPPPETPAPAPTYLPPPEVAAPPPAPAPPVQSVTVAAGTPIPIRLLDGVSSERNRPGDPFQATLEEALVADGILVADRGATVMGRVVAAQQSGRVAGLSELALELDRIRTVSGEVQIASDTMIRRAEASRGKDAATVGGMAGIGAAIGAIAGGRKGAGIGAAAGGAAGSGTVMTTRGKPVEFEPETRLTFRLRAPLTVTLDTSRIRQAGSSEARPRFERRY